MDEIPLTISKKGNNYELALIKVPNIKKYSQKFSDLDDLIGYMSTLETELLNRQWLYKYINNRDQSILESVRIGLLERTLRDTYFHLLLCRRVKEETKH
ncbi:hypothetical protein J4471_04450 [Candidatus Woesearchaeota archaeon]|nr:hypothetical protein [Candidatus Woesearchaeota archaeon]